MWLELHVNKQKRKLKNRLIGSNVRMRISDVKHVQENGARTVENINEGETNLFALLSTVNLWLFSGNEVVRIIIYILLGTFSALLHSHLLFGKESVHFCQT